MNGEEEEEEEGKGFAYVAFSVFDSYVSRLTLSGLFTKKKKKKRLELPTLNLYGDNYIPLSKQPNKQTHTFRLLHHNPKLCQGPTLQAGSGALS